MKSRRILSLILISTIALSSSCTRISPTKEVSVFKTMPGLPKYQLSAGLYEFEEETFPVLDGSTSMKPLGVGLRMGLLGEEDYQAENIEFHKTTNSFQYLINGESDLLLVAEPNASVYENMEKAGFEYEKDPIAVEGLVFMVNATNPVDSLTIDQVRDIYTGKIMNWKEVGGDDVEIVAFQRNESSGSQVMMQKLVMNDGESMISPVLTRIGTMNNTVEAIAGYSNTSNAIGYTVYYYAVDMEMATDLKLLKIDGVAPTRETIKSGEYSLYNYYYEFMASRDKASETTVILYDWLRSEDGKKLLSALGYVPV